MATDDNDYKLFHYRPSIEASILFVVLFALSTILHICQSVRTRTLFVLPVIIGGFCERLPPLLRFSHLSCFFRLHAD